MKKIKFTKMVATGNDFIVIEDNDLKINLSSFAKKICDRKFGIGADGMLLIGKSKKANVRMRIFNADGSEAEMCGNGARAAALYAGKKKVALETKAGIIQAEVSDNDVKIRLTEPKETIIGIPLKINNRTINVNFINTGVPHAVIFSEGLEEMDIIPMGRGVRHHKKFAPRGTNVNFVEVLGRDLIKVRTYERGVEDETLACGTGSTASALIFALASGISDRVRVKTQSGETLNIYFKKSGNSFSDVWLEGKAKIVYIGEYNHV